jgi:hypothetical protein
MILTEEELKDYVQVKNIPGFEHYLINPSTGYICHSKHNKRLGTPSPTGYIKCSLGRGPTRTSYYNHRINYIHHKGDIPRGHEVDHIDRNRSNNNINNLKLVTIQENRKNRVMRKKRNVGETNKKRVKALKYNNETKTYEVFGEYDSMYKASKVCGVNAGAISQIVKNGYYKKTKSYDDNIFRFEMIV